MSNLDPNSIIESSLFRDSVSLTQVRREHDAYWNEVWSRYTPEQKRQAESALFDFNADRLKKLEQQFNQELRQKALCRAAELKHQRLQAEQAEREREAENERIIRAREAIIRDEIIKTLQEQKRFEEEERRKDRELRKRAAQQHKQRLKGNRKVFDAEQKQRRAERIAAKKAAQKVLEEQRKQRRLAEREAKKAELEKQRYLAKVAKIEAKLAKQAEAKKKRLAQQKRRRQAREIARRRCRERDNKLIADRLTAMQIKLIEHAREIRKRYG